MAIHTFTVNVPNPTEKMVNVELRLEPVDPADLRRLARELPRAKLQTRELGISRDPCAVGEPRLRLRLRARSSVDVHVTVVTETPRGRATRAAVGFNLTDRRNGRVAGGVLLACVEPSPTDAAPVDVPTPKPCRVILARNPYTVAVGGDPRKVGAQALTPGETVELVAPLVNPLRSRLRGVTAYLEHLGGADAIFVPAAWNIGDLRPSEVFYATWVVAADGLLFGSFDVSVVVQSAGSDPTRLRAPFRITPERRPAKGRSRLRR